MSFAIHKSVSDNGGTIGDMVQSGDLVMPEVEIDDTTGNTVGAVNYRKFYLVNTGADDGAFAVWIDGDRFFDSVLLESTGDNQTSDGFDGSEAAVSAISVVVPPGQHVGFWIRQTIQSGLSVPASANTITLLIKET